MSESDPSVGCEGDPELLSALRRRIHARGSIPFDEFMEAALYAPHGGYYERGAAVLGRTGDFYTASDASSAFGEMLAEQIAECQGYCGPGSFDIVELGAGKGTLAADLLGRLLARHGALYRRLKYWIVERSAAMRSSQEGLLAARALEGKVRWADGIEKVRPGGVVGCVLANELYDALPVKLVTRKGGRLYERGVGIDEATGALAFADAPAEDPALLAYAEAYGLVPVDGAVAEAGLVAQSLARRVARALRRGFSIVIDYGDRAARLYDPAARPAGTLLAYHRHRASEDPFVRVGAQDLTAHVNFSALEDASTAEGLATMGLTTQHRFLIALGLADRITELSSFTAPADVRRRLAMMSLIHPEGMGSIFRVLVQGKGVGTAALRGLADPFAAAGSPWSGRRTETY